MRNKFIRFFISSTFADMKVERDLLQEVFKEIIPIYRQKGWQIETVDLRWGISTEAGYHNKTMQICEQELKRCQQLSPKPNFIILLGNRYGWIPLPEKIAMRDYEKLKMTNDEKILFDKWYHLDANALPDGHFLLKARIGDYRKDTIWKEQAENPLKELFLRNMSTINDSIQESFIEQQKSSQLFGLSATGQEIRIGALDTNDASEHVIAYFRHLTEIPEDKQKLYVESDIKYAQHLINLKKKLLTKLDYNNIYNACLSYSEYQQAQFANTFKGEMKQRLTYVIDHIKERCCKETANNENNVHMNIAVEEATNFAGRDEELKEIDHYLRDENLCCSLWIKSSSGAGKSSLLAKIVQKYQNEFHVICRFCGRTVDSSSAINLLRSIWWEMHLCDASGKCKKYKSLQDFPEEKHELLKCMSCMLKNFKSSKPILLIIDAINQVTEDIENFTRLDWIDEHLPASVKVIISSTEELKFNVAHDHIKICSLNCMGKDAWTMVSKILKSNGRRISKEQENKVKQIIKQSDQSAIFLDVLAKYLCFASSEDQFCKLPSTLTELVGFILNDLSRPEKHGQQIVRKVMSLLSVERIGLSQQEILDLLSLDNEFYAHVKADSYHDLPDTANRWIPPILLSRLISDISPFLRSLTTNAGQIITIYHQELRKAIAANYVSTDENRMETLYALFCYYHSHVGQQSFTHHAILEIINCGVELMEIARTKKQELFQKVGLKVWHLLTDNVSFLTLKSIYHQIDLMNDFRIVIPYFDIEAQKKLLWTQNALIRATRAIETDDHVPLTEKSDIMPNTEHFYCYLYNLPSDMPLRKAIDSFNDADTMMRNALSGSFTILNNGTLFIIPRIGRNPRMSDDGMFVASLFDNGHTIEIMDVRSPLNIRNLTVLKEVYDMQFSSNMRYAAIRTATSLYFIDTSTILFELKITENSDISLSADGNRLCVFCDDKVEIIDRTGMTLAHAKKILAARLTRSGRYVWIIDDNHTLKRYDIEEKEETTFRSFKKEEIKPRTDYINHQTVKYRLCQTAIISCNDTFCGIYYTDPKTSHQTLACIEYTSKDSYNMCHFEGNNIVFGTDGRILNNAYGYSIFQKGKDGNYPAPESIDIYWTCASNDLNLVLVVNDSYGRIIDVRKANHQYNEPSTGNTGINSLACSSDGEKIWAASGINMMFDCNQTVKSVSNSKISVWLPPVQECLYQYVAQIASAPDGTRLALSTERHSDNKGCEMLICDPNGNRYGNIFTGEFECLAINFSEDGQYIVAKTGHHIATPNPKLYLFDRDGHTILETKESSKQPSNDFACFSRNNKYVFLAHGYENTCDSCIDLHTVADPLCSTVFFRFLSRYPKGMMRIREKFFVVQPAIGNVFLSLNKEGNICYINLSSMRRATFNMPGTFEPMACSPSGRYIYLYNKGDLLIWDWLDTRKVINLMNHVQWIVPALDDHHIYIIRDDYMILLFNILTRKIEQKAFIGRSIYQHACAQGLAVANDFCEVALLHPKSSLKVNIPAPATFVRHWCLKNHQLGAPIAVCPACGHHISLSEKLSGVLKLAPDDFEDIHSSDWEDSRLHSHKCPNCHSLLNINPYII